MSRAAVSLFLFLAIATAGNAGSLGWSPASSMSVARQSFTMTRLQDGSVLVAGGFASFEVPGGETWRTTEFVEVYNPVADSWSPRPSMSEPRDDHKATLLGDGRVLVTGGDSNTTEFYDPATASWVPGPPMSGLRGGHSSTLLPDGRLLVAGGFTGSGYLATAEIYDPVTETWALTTPMINSRNDHSATVLDDGRVLIVGGTSSGTSPGKLAEIYDPITETWSPAAQLTHRRFNHTATLLPTGRVLVIGGNSAVTEIFDPATNIWADGAPTSELRRNHTAVTLLNGDILVAGGDGFSINDELATAEIYSPATGLFTLTASMSVVRTRHNAVLLVPDGDVLVAGGATFGSDCCLSDAERFGVAEPPVTFVVDTIADSVDSVPGDGVCSDGSSCSLRAAVMEANALPGQNVVQIPAGTYTLQLDGEGDAGGDLDINGALTLEGEGAANTVIDAAGIDRVVFVAGGIVADIVGVTLRNGDTDGLGGAVMNRGILTITDSEIVDSTSRSSFDGGGGIWNDGRMTVVSSTIAGNAAGGGGGIFNSGETTVVNSTLSGNLATDAVIPVRGHLARGGAIINDVFYGDLQLLHSTVTDNRADDEGGGLVNTCGGEFCGVTVVSRSIVAGNSAPTGPDCISEIALFGSGLSSFDFNQFGDLSGCAVNPDPNDLVGPLQLAPLAYYGGPTRTHALPATAPAADHIPPAECNASLDQRGIARPQGSGCDIGSYEAADCVVEAEIMADAGGLLADFVFGARGPGRWTTLLAVGGTVNPLWSLPLPGVDPPISLSVTLPVPAGTPATVVSVMRTGAGAVCVDFATGTAAAN